ncbi:hypothetical protein PRIC1_002971 [Phytophthora ramorum]|uniref:Zinc finger HIT domain-containing protein 3 n=1 Tax=Phytophthora ramorum TaxID=164328 RepID=UPI0030B65168|nr:Zinc finger HIT domain-containing protein 3 [Phytophthora ramorum]KAH7503507.1 Zinc finger HIT domain-containing protein 3 [Phytophthora ramorum]
MALPCVMCATTESKYKCPTCRAPYCSLVCCKKHKESPCEPAPEKPQEPPTVTPATAMEVQEEKEVDSAEKLTDEQIGVLKTSAGVKEMLGNVVITQALAQIDSSQDKMKALEKALLDPTFAKFMYQALDEVVPAK